MIGSSNEYYRSENVEIVEEGMEEVQLLMADNATERAGAMARG